MRVEVVKLPGELGEADRSEDVFVVVDVLRLSSTVLTAFGNDDLDDTVIETHCIGVRRGSSSPS